MPEVMPRHACSRARVTHDNLGILDIDCAVGVRRLDTRNSIMVSAGLAFDIQVAPIPTHMASLVGIKEDLL